MLADGGWFCYMKKILLMSYFFFIALTIWLSYLTFFYPMVTYHRIISLGTLITIIIVCYHFTKTNFFIQFQQGSLTIRQKKVEEYILLNRALKLINEENSLENVLRQIVEDAFQLIPTAESASLVIYNPIIDMFEFKNVKPCCNEHYLGLTMTPEEVEKMIQNKTKPFIDYNVKSSNTRLRKDLKEQIERFGTPRALLYIPIWIDRQFKGYITLDNWHRRNAFCHWDLYQIEQILPQIELAFSAAERKFKLSEYKSKLGQLYRVGQQLANIDNPEQLVKRVLSITRNTLKYSDICIFLLENNKLVFKGGYKGRLTYPAKGSDLELNEGICGWVATNGEALIVEDVTKEPRYLKRANGIRSELAVPIKADDEIFGVLNLESHKVAAFKNEEKELLMTVATQLGIALSNLQSQEKLKTALIQIITALAKSIETKDNKTGGHCERMESHALRLGKIFKLDEIRLENLRRAAILHDIGKIGIPSYILDKPGKLTSEEFKLIQQHPTFGGKILREVDFLKDVAMIVEQHHERIDGNGYPNGLKENQISMEAKIIAVVDAYDAMTVIRPYRRALLQSEAIQELLDNRKTQFDSEIVDIFVNLILSKTQEV